MGCYNMVCTVFFCAGLFALAYGEIWLTVICAKFGYMDGLRAAMRSLLADAVTADWLAAMVIFGLACLPGWLYVQAATRLYRRSQGRG